MHLSSFREYLDLEFASVKLKLNFPYGYIKENGQLNLLRFEKLMERLASIDYDHFNDIYADVKWLEIRHGRKKLVEVGST